ERVLGGGAESGPELRLEQLRLLEREPYAPDAQERVRLRPLWEVGEGLVRADVQRPQNQRAALEPLRNEGVRLVLLVLARHRVAVEKQELGAEKPDALGPVLDR